MYLNKTPELLKPLASDLVWDLPTTEKVMYVTFDDGPIPEVTPEVLEILKQYNAKGTFFCVGNNAALHPELLKRILAEGHAVGNHTYSHKNGWNTTQFAYLRDYQKCQDLLGTKLFRPPYGRIKRQQVNALKKRTRIIMWDVLSGDFDQNISPNKCLQNTLKHAKEGSIIVFHDSLKAKDRMLFAFPRFLHHFHELGFRFEAIRPGDIN
jgi:peptidoglycan-N-acetylglucosamine deacetylase